MNINKLLKTLCVFFSLVLLSGWLLASHEFWNRENFGSGWQPFLVWIICMFIPIFNFSIMLWLWMKETGIVEGSKNVEPIIPEKIEPHLAKYNNVCADINRYSNLTWQISLYAWGIYYTLIWYAFGLRCDATNKPYCAFPRPVFFIMMFLTAFIANIFLLVTELHIQNKKILIYDLEDKLSISSLKQFSVNVKDASGWVLIISVAIFLLAIWIPPLLMLYYK